MKDREICLTPDSARRIARAVQAVERMPAGSVSGNTPPRSITPAMCFSVTTQISASPDDLTPGEGAGTLMLFDRSSKKLSLSPKYVGIPIYSLSDYAIKVGATVQCVSMYGAWWYDVTKCGNGISPGS